MKDEKQIKSMLKDAMILLVITVVAGLCLGFVFEVTKAPIAAQKLNTKNAACLEVFCEAASFKTDESFNSEDAKKVIISAGYTQQDIDETMIAEDKDGNKIGYVLNVTTHEGYGGDILFSMGVKMDGTLNGISILSISETAGLGMKAKNPEFMEQWQNKKVDQFEYTKSGAVKDNQIDAISGATITTNAMTNGVNAGLAYFKSLEGGNLNE